MLKELNHYENLGTPNFFWELLNQIAVSKNSWTVKNTQEYFFNRIIDGRVIFDGCLALAEKIGIIKIDSKDLITLEASFTKHFLSQKYLQTKIIERIFLVLKDDDIFHAIFCSEHISYDIIYRSIQINNSAFYFKYANFKHLLISFGFLYPHPDKNIHRFVVNSRYKILFDKLILPEIRKRKIGIEEFEKISEKMQIYGEEAENFTVDYERKRLNGHDNLFGVEKISQYDIYAGYDVVSYNNVNSKEQDRFIEVKSFSESPSFFWSRNEIDVARIKKDKYFLYLIDRNQINNTDYVPITIQNPYEKILNNHSVWTKRVEKYFISQ